MRKVLDSREYDKFVPSRLRPEDRESSAVESIIGNLNDIPISSVNVASVNGAISVSTVAVQAKVGSISLLNRKVLVITPTTGPVWWGSNALVTILNGTKIYKNQSTFLEFTDIVPVYLIAESPVDVRIVEGS